MTTSDPPQTDPSPPVIEEGGAPGRHRKLVWLLGVAGVMLVVVLVVVAQAVRHHDPNLPKREVADYLAAWSTGNTKAMAELLDAPPPDLAAVANSLIRSAPAARQTFTVTDLTKSPDGAIAAYHAHVELAGFGPLEWDSTLPVVRVRSAWRIHWAEADLFPGLTGDQHLVLRPPRWDIRAPILGEDGAPLVSEQEARAVGLKPADLKDTKDLGQVQAKLSSVLGVDPATVQKALTAPGVQPNFFVPIITLRKERYDLVQAQLRPVKGIFFQTTKARLAVSDGLAAHVLGTVGEVTAERLRQLGPPYQVGRQVGLSGLEAVYETRLAGRPSAAVDIVEAGKTIRNVKQYPGSPPEPVQITLDLRTQQAAEAAVAGLAHPAALVAIDATTGKLRAVVSTPSNQPFDRALDGAYPPGSTFKVITAAALLSAGVTPSTPARCTQQLSVGGRTFTNFEGEALGEISLERAFAMSCNTAFVGLADQLSPGALAAAASSFGVGQPDTLPLATIGAKYPTPADRAEAAASAIGQGRVTASPLHMATVAAAVDSGRWLPPLLVLQPPQDLTAETTPALNPAVAETLRSFMDQVVKNGTGNAAAIPGERIFGKTGTAEFGNSTPPSTHAWFIGFRGSLAFAVLVQEGGIGGKDAAPLVNKFLAKVAQ